MVEGHDEVINRSASVPPKKNTEKPKKDDLTEVSEQLRALKNQVKTVEAENRRLQDEMNAPERQKAAQEQPVEGEGGRAIGCQAIAIVDSSTQEMAAHLLNPYR